MPRSEYPADAPSARRTSGRRPQLGGIRTRPRSPVRRIVPRRRCGRGPCPPARFGSPAVHREMEQLASRRPAGTPRRRRYSRTTRRPVHPGELRRTHHDRRHRRNRPAHRLEPYPAQPSQRRTGTPAAPHPRHTDHPPPSPDLTRWQPPLSGRRSGACDDAGVTDFATPQELARRTSAAVDAAVGAARDLGLVVTDAAVLHDMFSVVVHLGPAPVVARIPTVLSPAQMALLERRQQAELEVTAWLAGQGIPVIAPSAAVPREPVRRDGFTMTFWQYLEEDRGA